MPEQAETQDEIITRSASGIRAVEKALAGLTDAGLDLARAEGKWTIRQIAHHIADAELLWEVAIKSALGETLGASGALQTVAILEHMHQGELPGIRGLENLDQNLPTASRENHTADMTNGLVLSFGLDGNCCALIVSKA